MFNWTFFLLSYEIKAIVCASAFLREELHTKIYKRVWKETHKRGNLTCKDIKWVTVIKLSSSGAHNELLYIGTEYHRKSSTAISCQDNTKYSGGQVKSQEGDIYLSFLLTRTSILCQNPSCFCKITGS